MRKEDNYTTAEVHKKIVDGIKSYKNSKQIADSLGITVTGVNYHIRKLFRRFNVTNRRSLFLYLKGLPDLSGKSEVKITKSQVNLSIVDIDMDNFIALDKLKTAVIGLQRIRERFPSSTSMHQIADIYLTKIGMEVIDDKLMKKEVVNVEHPFK